MQKSFKNYRKLAVVSLTFILLLIVYFSFAKPLLSTGSKVTIYSTEITANMIVESILWLLASYIITIIVNSFIWDNLIQKDNGSVPGLLKSATSVVFFLLAIIGITSHVLQKSIATLLATTGALSLLIGFSMRHVIENAVQSVAINLQRIFKPGDIISIPGKFDELAEVKDIDMSNTYLKDFVGNIIAIPNSVVSANLVRNYSHPHENIFSIYFNITVSAAGLSVSETILILSAVIASTDFVISYPKYRILIARVESTQVKYNISCWAARNKVNPLQAKHLLYLKIIEHLASAGFDIGTQPAAADTLDFEKKIVLAVQEVLAYKDGSKHAGPIPNNSSAADKKALTILKRSGLFAHLAQEEITEINQHKKIVYFKAHETILKPNESSNMIYIVVEGVLQKYVVMQDQQVRIPLNKLVPGDYYGTYFLSAQENHLHTIIAITDVMAYGFDQHKIIDILEQHPEIMHKIANNTKEELNLITQKEQQFHIKYHNNVTKNKLHHLIDKCKKLFKRAH